MKGLVTAASVVALLAAGGISQSLPQVDLGYEVHQALSYNVRSSYKSGRRQQLNDFQNATNSYNFNNIRFAQPPVGALRFAAPVPPSGRNPVVQNGSFSPICPQALPGWSSIGNAFVAAFAAGNQSSFNYASAVASAQAAAATAAPYQPSAQETEDCLFLDVVVPKSIFDNANSNSMRRRAASSSGAPVLVW